MGEKRGTGKKGSNRGSEFDVLGSKFRQPRTLHLAPPASRALCGAEE
jgi:hypothetical protein